MTSPAIEQQRVSVKGAASPRTAPARRRKAMPIAKRPTINVRLSSAGKRRGRLRW